MLAFIYTESLQFLQLPKLKNALQNNSLLSNWSFLCFLPGWAEMYWRKKSLWLLSSTGYIEVRSACATLRLRHKWTIADKFFFISSVLLFNLFSPKGDPKLISRCSINSWRIPYSSLLKSLTKSKAVRSWKGEHAVLYLESV